MTIDHTFKWSPGRNPNLESLKVLVVGGTEGLGRAISKHLAHAGAKVTVAGKSFQDRDTKNLDFVECDLCSMKSSRVFARQLDISEVDIVLFATETVGASSKQTTSEGLEKTVAVNFLSRLVMLREMVPRIQKSKSIIGPTPRVFFMARTGENQLGNPKDLNSEKTYGPLSAQLNAVVGNEALLYHCVKEYENANFYGLNLGAIHTHQRENDRSWWKSAEDSVVGLFTRSPDHYAEGVVQLMVVPELDQRNGGIFNSHGKALLRSKGMTDDYAAAYINASEELLREKGLP